MTSHIFGRMTWRGRDLRVSAPDASWFEWLTLFTGLAVRPTPASEGPVVLAVEDSRHVRVDGRAQRSFESEADLRVWLGLTVSDVLIQRSDLTVLHAAAFLVDGRAVLVSGPPWSGKSSFALEARQLGLPVLGDDQVGLDPSSERVFAVPRPIKRRIRSHADRAGVSAKAVQARIEDEDVALEPPGPAVASSFDEGRPVGLVLQVARHAGPGVRFEVPTPFEASRALLDQMRCYAPEFLPALGECARFLGRCPIRRVSVGDGETHSAVLEACSIAAAETGRLRQDP